MEEIIEHDNATETATKQIRSPVAANNICQLFQLIHIISKIYVRLLPAGTGTVTTELLRLCSPGVGDEEGPVVRDELLLELERACCVKVLGVVRNDRLRDRLSNGVHLRSVSTTLHAKTNVNGGEGLLASDKDGFIDLEAQKLGLEQGNGGAVDVNETATLLRVRNRSCGLICDTIQLVNATTLNCH